MQQQELSLKSYLEYLAVNSYKWEKLARRGKHNVILSASEEGIHHCHVSYQERVKLMLVRASTRYSFLYCAKNPPTLSMLLIAGMIVYFIYHYCLLIVLIT